MRVQQLQQRGERVVVAVVRRRGEEQPVLAVRRERADRRGSQGVAGVAAARTGRGAVVDLVDDQDVVAARDLRMRRAAPRAAGACPASPFSQSIETISRGKCANGLAPTPRERRSWPSSSRSTIRNSRPNFSRISSRHCSCSDAGQTTSAVRARWRRSSSWTTSPASIVLPRPTSSAISSVVARHSQRAHERLELVVLDRDAAAERRLQRALIGARHRAPADGIEERVELGGVVEPVGGDAPAARHAR